MTYKKTKEGQEFEKALAVVKARIEKQLRLNGKLTGKQTFSIQTRDWTDEIGASVFSGKRCVEICDLYPNGKFKY